jgi:succinate-acetate transporter protein
MSLAGDRAARTSQSGEDRISRSLASADMIRINLRPLASSLPLGFFAFGTGTVLLTAVELGWVPAGQVKDLMILVLAFVTPLELLAGIFAFLARDVGAATGLTLLGAAWAGTALLLITGSTADRSPALGVFLLTMAVNMIALASGAMRTKPAFAALLLVGASRFVLTGVYQVAQGGSNATERISGWIGLPLAVFALYGGLALLLEDAAQRTILPIGRRGRAKSSIEGDISHQIEQAEREAGIRRQL